MKKHIFIFSITPIILLLIIISFLSYSLARSNYTSEVEEKSRLQISYIQNLLLNDKSHYDSNKFSENLSKSLNSYLSQATKLSSYSNNETKCRISIISLSGNVIADTERKISENHFNRPEIVQARTAIDGLGYSERKSTTTKIEYLYVAYKVKLSNFSEPVYLRIAEPLKKISGMMTGTFYLLIATIILSIGISIFLMFFINRKLSRPLAMVKQFTKSISEGNYQARLPVAFAQEKPDSELAHLANSFNTMADKLESSFVDINQKNAELNTVMNSTGEGIIAIDPNGIVTHINQTAVEYFSLTNIKAVIGKSIFQAIPLNDLHALIQKAMSTKTSHSSDITLHLSNNVYNLYINLIQNKTSNIFGYAIVIHDITEIRKLVQMRADFVSNITHELRTPLTSIQGYIETLQNGAIDDITIRDKFLQIIEIETDRLYSLINDILQLSEIEQISSDKKMETFKLKDLIDEVCTLLSKNAAKSQIALENKANSVYMYANRNRIKQLLINLIDNGIKYSLPNGTVTISAVSAAKTVIISVKDTGIGIPKDEINSIFERFYRVDKSRSREVGGTGLGLSIVKHITSLYNGTIQVNSTIGKGSEFIIKFPQ